MASRLDAAEFLNEELNWNKVIMVGFAIGGLGCYHNIVEKKERKLKKL